MLITVIVPHLNQPDLLAKCLASLQANRRAPDEIIVVDNGSTSLPDKICAQVPNLTLVQELKPGPGPARNLGISYARGDVLAFIDADCTAHPDWLAVAEREMRKASTQILGGDVRIAYADPDNLTSLEAYESIYAYRMDRYIAREGYTGTGNLVVRQQVVSSVGPFAGIGVAEDKDWGQRASALGFQTRYVADMTVYHPARSDFAGIRAKWDRHIAHEYGASRGSALGRLRYASKTLAMIFSPLAELPRVVASRRIHGPRVRLRAFLALVRIRAYRARIMWRLLFFGGADQMSERWNRP